jgi:hypothetical protein
VRQRAPHTVRMLLTGHADMHDAIDAVNRGNILHFLTKPCPRDVLIAAINSGLDQYHISMEEKSLMQKARAAQRSRVDWDADDSGKGDGFESPAGLPGPKEAKAFLTPLVGKDSTSYIVVLRLSVLRTVELRYGEGFALEYLRSAIGFLQQTLRSGDRLFHCRRDVVMAVVQRFIAPSAVRTEMDRLIADTRRYVIEVQGRPTMIACLITFDLLPASQFANFDALMEACNSSHAAEPTGVS